jgi:hypothetical protein
LKPTADHAQIIAAFRMKARVLHPDVPQTGNAEAFVAMKQAYDELSNRQRREVYDRRAREALFSPIGPEVRVSSRVVFAVPTSERQPSLFSLPWPVLVGLAAFLSLGVYQTTMHLMAARPPVHAGIRPNAATVVALSPAAHQTVVYGEKPVRLAGTPNFYVKPTADLATIWFLDTNRNAYVSLGQLPPFSAVQAVRLIRENGMFEILLNERGNGFIRAEHLTPGNAVAARQAYCGYNAGATPYDGEVLDLRGHGNGSLEVENRASQPTVIKLRDSAGGVALAVYLGPGGHAEYSGLPDGAYRAEYALGELWSRACNTFTVGTRARRLDASIILPGDSYLVVAPESSLTLSSEIAEQTYERN